MHMSTDQPTGRGSIGNEIFEQVEKMVAADGITRSDAFQRLSDQTGRRAGTVAANYYRVARLRGATLQPRVRKGSAASGASEIEAVLGRVSRAMDELTDLVHRQQEELNRLRERGDQLDKLRRLLAE